MKKSIFLLTLSLAVSSAFAIEKALDIRPTVNKTAAPTSVGWERANDTALAAATTDETLAAFVADEASAKALLAQVKGAYATDPLVAVQVAAVSQWTMQPDAWYCLFWDGERAKGRRVWVQALVATAEESADSYVKEFMLDQLRWCGCGCPCLIARIRALAKASGDKAVADFAEVVIRELEGRGIGR